MPDPKIIGGSRPIEDVLGELAKEVPDEEWRNLPPDLSDNLDHYLYGTPKGSAPLIRGGSRVACTAAIVLACIVLYGLVMILKASFPSGEHGLPERVPVLSFSTNSLGSLRRPDMEPDTNERRKPERNRSNANDVG